MNNYVTYHLHSMDSLLDSATHYKDYKEYKEFWESGLLGDSKRLREYLKHI